MIDCQGAANNSNVVYGWLEFRIFPSLAIPMAHLLTLHIPLILVSQWAQAFILSMDCNDSTSGISQ